MKAKCSPTVSGLPAAAKVLRGRKPWSKNLFTNGEYPLGKTIRFEDPVQNHRRADAERLQFDGQDVDDPILASFGSVYVQKRILAITYLQGISHRLSAKKMSGEATVQAN